MMIFYFIYFLIATFLTFFIPGDLWISRIRSLTIWQRVGLSYVLGIVLFALQGFLFGFLQIRFMTYIYLVVTAIIWFYINRAEISKFLKYDWRSKLKLDKWLVGILILGVVTQMLTLAPMGWISGDRMYFCCNLPDSLYHIALTQQLVKAFPPFEPGMSEMVVHNYHYLTNLVYADLIRVFKLPLIATQYEYGGLFFTLLLAFSVLSLAQTLKLSQGVKRWLLFFLFFSGDLVFWLFLLLGRGLNFDIHGLHDAARLWFSPPRVLAAIIFFSGLDLFLRYLSKPSRILLVAIALLWGSLAGFKIYVAVYAIAGLFFLMLYELIRRRWRSPHILLFIMTVLVAISIYLPVNAGSGGFEWNGFWRFENFFADPTTINLVKLESARVNFLNTNNLLFVALIEFIYIVGYIILNYGVILIGLVQTRKTLGLIPREAHIVLISGALVSLILGFFFLQNPGYANTSQFIITVGIVFIIYAAIVADHWTSRLGSRLGLALLIIIVVLTVVRPLSTVGENVYKLVTKQMYSIDRDELNALEYLRTQTPKDSLLLVDPFFASDNLCYYAAILSERSIFLCGKSIMDDHGVDVKTRYDRVVRINQASYKKDPRVGEYLAEDNIDYVYVRNLTYTFDKKMVAKYATPVFQSSTISIYRVDR